ncbi:hypothetical protein SCG7109_AY_00080 [Chlamydiales bacterium SCGC AG-110-M15]|nr:hypothetical protein SCG7109_AY_00080 [Chlamydiales bacterium SCGC AG-110-M15]
MDMSMALARFLGFFFTIVGFSFLKDSNRLKAIASEVQTNKGLQFIAGIFPTLVGSLTVSLQMLSPQPWWFVCLFGYFLLFIGAFRLIFTDVWLGVIKKLGDKFSSRFIGGIVTAIGLFFLLMSWA